MNRIWVRLTVAFLSVALVTVIMVAVLAGWSAGDQFHVYVTERNQALLMGETREMQFAD